MLMALELFEVFFNLVKKLTDLIKCPFRDLSVSTPKQHVEASQATTLVVVRSKKPFVQRSENVRNTVEKLLEVQFGLADLGHVPWIGPVQQVHENVVTNLCDVIGIPVNDAAFVVFGTFR